MVVKPEATGYPCWFIYYQEGYVKAFHENLVDMIGQPTNREAVAKIGYGNHVVVNKDSCKTVNKYYTSVTAGSYSFYSKLPLNKKTDSSSPNEAAVIRINDLLLLLSIRKYISTKSFSIIKTGWQESDRKLCRYYIDNRANKRK